MAKDSDGDGIPDHRDRCPRHPEDVDGHRDEDGCPEVDCEIEGIADFENRYPQVEPWPDIKFEPGRAELTAETIIGMSCVATSLENALLNNRSVRRVLIVCYTEGQGRRLRDLRLSQSRAEAVLRELRECGVDSKLLEAVGRWNVRPKRRFHTPDGEKTNSLVEAIYLSN